MTLFCTTCVENSASVARVASPSTMAGLRANGAIVSTYLSVLVTVLMAHTDRTDTGMRIAASTTSTRAEIRRGRCPRRGLSLLTLELSAGCDGFSGSPSGAESASPASSGCIWGSVSLIGADSSGIPSANWAGAHAFPGCTTTSVKQKGSGANHQRLVAVSAISGFLAPLVFVGVIVLRKVNRRSRTHFRRWNKRLQHEIHAGAERPHAGTMLTGFAHSAVCVPDVEAATRWYSEVLGLEVLSPPYRMEGAQISTIWLSWCPPLWSSHTAIVGFGKDDRVIELIEYPAADVAPPESGRPAVTRVGITHIGVLCDDIDATRTELEARGVAFLTTGIADVAGLRTTWCHDPWGTVDRPSWKSTKTRSPTGASGCAEGAADTVPSPVTGQTALGSDDFR